MDCADNYYVFPRLVKMFFLIQNTMDTVCTLVTLNTTQEGSEVEKLDLYDNYKKIIINIEWWINSIAYIIIFGGLGNILTFMKRGFLKNVLMCLCLSILTLVNKGK